MPRIPWQLILTRGPVLIDRATKLISISRDISLGISAAKDVPSLREQVAALSTNQQDNADLLKQVTDHVDALTRGAQGAALRARWGLAVGLIALALGVVACVLALSLR